MDYYLDENNVVHALDAGSDPAEWIKGETKKITENEAISIVNPPPTHEQLVAEAEAKKQYLLSEAADAIAPLQDAVDLDMATPEEESALKEWKKYRVLLSRVDTSLGAGVVWPTPPASLAR